MDPGDLVALTFECWNATLAQTGQSVTAHDNGNATINPGASTSFGFLGTWRISDASPVAFTLNGTACIS
jgi:hypothetical protein